MDPTGFADLNISAIFPHGPYKYSVFAFLFVCCVRVCDVAVSVLTIFGWDFPNFYDAEARAKVTHGLLLAPEFPDAKHLHRQWVARDL